MCVSLLRILDQNLTFVVYIRLIRPIKLQPPTKYHSSQPQTTYHSLLINSMVTRGLQQIKSSIKYQYLFTQVGTESRRCKIKTRTTILLRNAGWAHSRNTSKLSLIFYYLMNESSVSTTSHPTLKICLFKL